MMEKVQEIEDANGLKENRMIGRPKMINSRISFSGKGNILYCEDGVILKNSKIDFNGDHSIVFLQKSRMDTVLNVSLNFDSVFGFGCENYVNGILNVVISEQTNVLIGRDCVISFGCWLRTGDPHLIYDAQSMRRINLSKSIYLGDHVWLGQGAVLLKNTRIGSGSIVGAMSVVPGKELISNASYAGNPCRLVRTNIFFTGDCVHRYRKKETEQHKVYQKGGTFIYKRDEDTLNFDDIEKRLREERDVDKKLDYVKTLYENTGKNRFAISKPEKKSALFGRKRG